jgi:hypothetical protein
VALVVTLEDAEGNVLTVPDPNGGTCDAAGDFDGLLPFDQRFPVLATIDPDGETVLDASHMAGLRADLAAVSDFVREERARRGLARLEALAKRCAEQNDLAIHFRGD